MFILVPFILILASVIGISIIIFRKMPYLNKLTPETHAESDILIDLFPEFSEGFKNLKLKEYGNLWLIELEKLLRKLRVISLKMDRISDSWIKRIRRGNSLRTITSVVFEKTETEKTAVLKIQSSPKTTLEDEKREEQGLIIEIAKNPKNFRLYETLGDLYVKMNNFSDARESFEAAIELNSNNDGLQKKLSQVLEKMVI